MITKSLPSRERGLKFRPRLLFLENVKSLPSRERGLKFNRWKNDGLTTASLPSRERGLKFGLWVTGEGVVCRSLRGSVD